MDATATTHPDTFAEAAAEAAAEIEGHTALRDHRSRLLALPRYLSRFGDALAATLEELVTPLTAIDAAAAVRVSGLLVDVLLAEEGFSRGYWRAFRRHLRLLHETASPDECEACLRETLDLAAALG